MKYAALSLLALASTAAFAQEDVEKRYQAVTTIEFDDASINALPDKPTGTIVIERPPFRPTSMIELRANFNDEIAQSPAELR